MKLYSHPRSGTNWALALIGQAFYGIATVQPAQSGHWAQRVTVNARALELHGGHIFYRKPFPKGSLVYLYRDGRDVLASLWRTKAFQHPSRRNQTFAQFLRTKLDWYATPGRKSRKRLLPAVHWRRHLDTWATAPGVYMLRYEELLLDTPGELERLGAFLGLTPNLSALDVGDVGPFPSSDHRIAKWRDVFTDADLEFFTRNVSAEHWGLWNG